MRRRSFALINERSVRSTFTQTVRAGQTRLTFTAPEFEGHYRLYMTTGQPARCHWFSDLTTECALGTLTVAGDAIEDAINFENQVLLADGAARSGYAEAQRSDQGRSDVARLEDVAGQLHRVRASGGAGWQGARAGRSMAGAGHAAHVELDGGAGGG